MKHPDYYRHGGVEKHHDGSFTIYGTIENPEPTLFKQRYYDYTIESALKNQQTATAVVLTHISPTMLWS